MASIFRLGLLLAASTSVVAHAHSVFHSRDSINATYYGQNSSKPVDVPVFSFVHPHTLDSQSTASEVESSQTTAQPLETCAAVTVTSISTLTEYAATSTAYVADTTIYEYVQTIYESIQTIYAATTVPLVTSTVYISVEGDGSEGGLSDGGVAGYTTVFAPGQSAVAVAEYVVEETKTYTTTIYGYDGQPSTITEYIVVESTVTSYPAASVTSAGGSSAKSSASSIPSVTPSSVRYSNSTLGHTVATSSTTSLPYSTGASSSRLLVVNTTTVSLNLTASATSTVAFNTTTSESVTPTATLSVCESNSDAIEALNEVETATGFCQQYLQMSTLSFTETSTSIPPRINTTVTTTMTAANVSITTVIDTAVTSFTTVTETSSPVTTLTQTSYTSSVRSCFTAIETFTATPIASSTSYIVSATTSVMPRSFASIAARNSSSIELPYAIARYDSDSISAACSCLSPPVPSITFTATTMLVAETSTVAANATVTPTTIITTTSTAFITSTEISTTTLDIATTTEVLTLTTPTLVFNGLNYYAYENTYDYSSSINPNYKTSSWNQNSNYFQSGKVTNLNAIATYSWPSVNTCGLPGQADQDCGQLTLVIQGYFYAATAGSYTFTTNVNYNDNQLTLWTGEKAYNSWTDSNFDYSSVRAGYTANTGGSVTHTYAAGEVIPMTVIWINGGGAGRLNFNVQTPDGVFHSDTTGFFLSTCAVGNPFTP